MTTSIFNLVLDWRAIVAFPATFPKSAWVIGTYKVAIDVDKDEIRNSIEGKNVYNSKAEPVLVTFSDLYSELDLIFIDVSRFFSYFTLYYLLTT